MLGRLMIHQLYHFYLTAEVSLLSLLRLENTDIAEKLRQTMWEEEWKMGQEQNHECKLGEAKITWAKNRPRHYQKHEKSYTS